MIMKSTKPKKDKGEKAQLTAWTEEDEDDDLEDAEDEGCCKTKCACLTSLWATREMNTNNKDREIYVRTTIRELVVYVIFLIILAVVTFGMTTPIMYFYTKVMMQLFLDSKYPDTKNTFRGSSQVMDVWRFSENVLLDNLYWQYWYNRDLQRERAEELRKAEMAKRQSEYGPYAYAEPIKIEKANQDTQDHRRILFQNHLLGLARLKQIRVANQSCNVPNDFSSTIYSCYAAYSTASENTTTPKSRTGKKWWTYTPESESNSATYWGKLATYSSAGNIQDLPKNREQTRKLLSDLKKIRWLDRGTRVVTIDFTTYNANINLFCVVTLAFEIPPTGGLIPSFSFHTVKLLRYVSRGDYAIMACEIIFAIYILYYIVEEILEIKQLGKYYFYKFWNLLDIAVIGMSIACVIYSVIRYIVVKEKLQNLMENDDQYTDFSSIGFWQTQFNNVIAITTFLAWIKLFKYISFNKTMAQLNATLGQCGKDLLGFAVMFFIVFLAYAQAGYIVFGSQVYDYSTYGMAVFTLFRIILGDFNFAEIEQANRILGPMFFVTYIFFVFFVLLNMFLAIINDTYSDVKDRKTTFKNSFEITDYLKRGYNNLMGKVGRRSQIIDIQNALKMADSNSDGDLTFDCIRTELKKYNFSETEIQLLLSRFDYDGDQKLDEGEKKIMYAQLAGDKAKLEREIAEYESEMGHTRPATKSTRRGSDVDSLAFLNQPVHSYNTTKEDMDQLKTRVERMEGDLDSIASKIDAVVEKLEAMGKDKGKMNMKTPSKELSDWDLE